MQKDLTIKTNDGFVVYATHDNVGSDALVIFIHGITGRKEEHHYIGGSKFFNKHGIDTLRFSFYPRREEVRKLSESSITTHAKDLQTIIDQFKEKYEKIVLVGHSLGAIVILNLDLSDIHKVVLWDPTCPIEDVEGYHIHWNEDLGKYIMDWGKEMLVSKEMVDEWVNFDIGELLEKVPVPIKIVFAGNRKKYDVWKNYLDRIPVENAYSIIEGTSHEFIEEDKVQELFDETLKWLK
ncbi:hypothetical protein GF389_04680 [Candidatus Dojkabacteria bacterium]|nr:hypothetical protein [Candidatus Dojkabacteria bacterium]